MLDPSTLLGTKLANYRIERVIGRGRMGIVFLARDEALLRPTAIKILSWQSKDNEGQNPEDWFLAEARSAARINHPNVVLIYGVARQGPHCYIAMEYLAGGAVDALVQKKGPMTPARATEALMRCADAMQAAHDAGIIHRDVKPENLLIAADGNVKLSDFGMALQLSRPRPNEPARAGTPFYTAPEIWNGEAASAKSDIYALGATYHFMLTGRVPYEAADLRSLISAHLGERIPQIVNPERHLFEGCNYIIRNCLAKSPKDRFACARALGAVAREVLQSLEAKPFELLVRVPSEDSTPITQRPTERSLRTATVASVAHDDLRPEQWDLLLQWLVEDRAHALVLLGERGSGRTTLLGRLTGRIATQGLVICLDGSTMTTFGNLGAQLEHEFHKLSSEMTSKNLRRVDWSLLGQSERVGLVLFVVDAENESIETFGALASALTTPGLTFRWKIVASGSTDDAEVWRQKASEFPTLGLKFTELSRLTLPQSYAYVRSKANALQVSGRGLRLTPDAMLLAAYFGTGNPGRIDEMIDSLQRSGQYAGKGVVTSREVWEVQFHDLPQLDSSEGSADESDRWPTHTVREILNQCRAVCGIPMREKQTRR